MKFFYKYFGKHNHESEQGELFVKCPFPHTDSKTGEIYYESRPSAHINVDESLFHCKVCDTGMNEVKFLMEMQNLTYPEALRVLDMMTENTDDWGKWEENLKSSPETLKKIEELGLTSVKDSLRLGYMGNGIAFPIFVFGELMSHMEYRPGEQVKAVLAKGSKQLIFPFDLWREDNRDTLLCAGFKDAAIARSKGFNAITFSHGEQSFPKLFKHSFKDRKVYIAYDNDVAGWEGARKTAAKLKEVGAFPYIIDLSLVCTEKGEDIHDYFMKYGKTSESLQQLMKESPPFSEEEFQEERNKLYPLVSLEEATHAAYTNKIISSRVSVVATYEESMEIPDVVEVIKTNETEKCTMFQGEVRTWTLDDTNLSDILYLCDSNLKKEDVETNIKKLLGIPKNERFLRFRFRSRRTVWKAVVMDDTETEIIEDGKEYKPAELNVYSLDIRMSNSDKYRIFYLRTPHPLQAMKNVGIINRIEESDNSINQFKVTDDVLSSLHVFQGDVNVKMKEIAERAKGIVGAELNEDIFYTVELFYHTPLYFHFGRRKNIRAFLEPMIVGESSTGKSRTSKQLMEMYQLGRFISLKNATVPALIGGTDKSTHKTRLGAIPRSHKGAVILEEFSGAPPAFIKTITDMRTSNRVRLERVSSGTVDAPAMVRMLTLSNQKTGSNGQSIPLRQYPNGVKVLLDLIGAAEDVRRYDFFTIVDKPGYADYVSPLETIDVEPYPEESYRNRIRWIWSRKADQIIMDDDVKQYIVKCAHKLNERYDNHIQFFGAEGWIKLARIAIATAACVASTDASGENLIVKMEHVAWAANFFKSRYDNSMFKIKDYVENERKYSECPPSSVQALQGLYNKHATLINYMEQSTEINQNQLRVVSGLPQDDFSEVMNRLVACAFVHLGDKVIPSERFRRAAARINRNQYMKKVGEE